MSITIATTVTTLLFASITFALTLANPDRAQSYPSADIASVNAEKIATQSPRNSNLARNPDRAMEFVHQALEAEKSGDESQALELYGQALQIDDECGYAYLFSAPIIAKFDKDLAIEFGKAAAACFAQEGNKAGFNAAIAFLTELGVEF
jgi:hypothetical protein